MKRVRIMGLCIVAALVVSAAAAASAMAEAPEIGRCVKVAAKTGKFTSSSCTKEKSGSSYEWVAGAEKGGFTGTGTAATLETVTKVKVTCKAETSSGDITSPKTVYINKVIFTGCESLAKKCTTAGAAEGEVVTNPLVGELHWENKASKKVSLDLVPAMGELFVQFVCGPAAAEVKGSILVPLKADKMETSPVEKFKASKGKQKPEAYETSTGEKVVDVLQSKIGATEFEQSGQTVTNTQVDEEALEISAVV